MKATRAFIAMGAAGRADAIRVGSLAVQNAASMEEARAAEQLLVQARALPEIGAQPAAAPAAGAPAPAAPEAAPAPAAPKPRPRPEDAVDRVGDAEWSSTLGFVRPAEFDAKKDAPGLEGKTVPQTAPLDLNRSFFEMGAGMVSLNPSDDGTTEDATGFKLLELRTGVRAEFRHMTSLFAPWFDIGFRAMFGERTQTDTNQTMGVQSLQPSGRFGVDVHPARFVGIGPFVGYRLDLWNANVTANDTELTNNSFEVDHGLLFGAHARFRTKESPTEAPIFYADPNLSFRVGTQNAVHGGVDLGVTLADVTLHAWFERRLSVSGGFTYAPGAPGDSADATNLSQAFAASSPMEQRLGAGVGFIL